MDWEKLGRTITMTGKGVSDKVKETANLVSLQQKQASTKTRLSEAYEKIGKLCYEANSSEVPAGMEDLFFEVTQILRELDERQSEINDLKGTVLCTGCGAEVAKEASFCPKCGARITQPEADNVTDADFEEMHEEAEAEEAAETEEPSEEEAAAEETAAEE